MSQSPNQNSNMLQKDDLLHHEPRYQNNNDSGTGLNKKLWSNAASKLMLKLVQENLHIMYNEKGFKDKRKLWRFVKQKLDAAGHYYSASQIEGKYRYMQKYYRNEEQFNMEQQQATGNGNGNETTFPKEPEFGSRPEIQSQSHKQKLEPQPGCSKNIHEKDVKYGEIFDLLEEWGLADLKAKFKANYIVLQALEYLTEADIIELIPKIGQRAIFRAKLHQWRQQKSSSCTNVPEPKKIKIEPGIEVRSQPQLQQQMEIQTQPRIEQQVVPKSIIQSSNTVHKVYGNLTKVTKPKAKRVNKKANNNLNNTQSPNIQSRVQQFIIGSPPSTIVTSNSGTTGISRLPSPPSVTTAPMNGTKITMSSPTSLFYNLPPHIECRRYPSNTSPRSPASPQINTPVSIQIHNPISAQIVNPLSSQITAPVPTKVISSDNLCNLNALSPRSHPPLKSAQTYAADLTPFATSIIRVETKCEPQYSNNGEVSSKQGKLKRTTIIQKLTPDNKTSPSQTMPKPLVTPKPIEKLKKSPASEVKKSTEVTKPTETSKSPEVPKPKTLIIPKEEPIEITEDEDDTMDATDWNDYCEKQTIPVKIQSVVGSKNLEEETERLTELAHEPEHQMDSEQEPELEAEPEHDAEHENEADPEHESVAEPEPEGEIEIDRETNPEIEEFTLADDVTELPDIIKEELLDSDSRSDQEENVNNNDTDLLEEMKDNSQDSENSLDTRGEVNRIDIRNVLMSSKLGRRVIKRYVAEEMLDEPTRRLLIETIAQYCFDNRIHITPTYCKGIAEEIIEIFPNERMEDYWVRKGKKLRPPIYTKYHGIRREFFRKKALAMSSVINSKSNESEIKSSLVHENDYDDDDNLIIS